jgi:hypothetical protein
MTDQWLYWPAPGMDQHRMYSTLLSNVGLMVFSHESVIAPHFQVLGSDGLALRHRPLLPCPPFPHIF